MFALKYLLKVNVSGRSTYVDIADTAIQVGGAREDQSFVLKV
jgi:hypothetical protein